MSLAQRCGGGRVVAPAGIESLPASRCLPNGTVRALSARKLDAMEEVSPWAVSYSGPGA
jgi:hypothetical protein